MKLETERLIIRRLRESDLDDFYEYRSDPRVSELQGYDPMTWEKAASYIAVLKDLEFGRPGQWAQVGVELKSERKIIGDVGLKPESHDARLVEFGISFSPVHQKKGLASEALAAILDHLFAERGVRRVTAVTDVENASCIRLLENLKFRREGAYRESFWDGSKNEWRDEFLYAVLAAEWAANRRK
jgi:RimJ/RimL family protein N-acetyltransferase